MNKIVLFAVAATVLTAGAALAGDATFKPTVPEIDALAGLSAIAAVGAAVALVRERFKR